MLKTTKTLITIALASVAAPAAAGSWPDIPKRNANAPAVIAPAARTNVADTKSADGFVEGVAESGASLEQYRHFRNEENERPVIVFRAKRDARAHDAAADPNAGYAFAQGEGGWQLAPHKLVLAGGRLAHSDECDHAIRVAKAPTQDDLDAARLASPGV